MMAIKKVKDLKEKRESLKRDLAHLQESSPVSFQSEKYWQAKHIEREIEDVKNCLALNEQLKECETWEDFQALLEKMDSYGRGYTIVGNRRGYDAYDFTHMGDSSKVAEWNLEPDWWYEMKKNHVHYLYSDSVSTGQAHVKNLYRALTVVP